MRVGAVIKQRRRLLYYLDFFYRARRRASQLAGLSVRANKCQNHLQFLSLNPAPFCLRSFRWRRSGSPGRLCFRASPVSMLNSVSAGIVSLHVAPRTHLYMIV